jgi:hypothetical protein
MGKVVRKAPNPSSTFWLGKFVSFYGYQLASVST